MLLARATGDATGARLRRLPPVVCATSAGHRRGEACLAVGGSHRRPRSGRAGTGVRVRGRGRDLRAHGADAFPGLARRPARRADGVRPAGAAQGLPRPPVGADRVPGCGSRRRAPDRGVPLPNELAAMLAMARDLGLGALVESHSDADLEKVLATDAEVVGVNARDLETLEVDRDRALAPWPDPRRPVGGHGERDRDARSRARRCRRRRVCHPCRRSVDARRRSRSHAPGAAGRGELTMSAVAERTMPSVPDERGRFGTYGGRYVPEVLIPALDELAEAWSALRDDPGFRTEFGDLLRDFVGRPTPITHARAALGGAGVRDLAEARGPGPHRGAQDQQRARAGARREAAGQGAHHRGDRCGPARRRGGDGLRAPRACRAWSTWARKTRTGRRPTSRG